MEIASVGTDFYFAPAADTTWSLSQQAFIDALKVQWPEAVVEVNQFSDKRSYVSFFIATQYYDGFFTNNENLVFEKQTPVEAADFIEWFLGLLPKDARIRFSSEIAAESGINDDWWLPRDSGKQQIAEALTDHLAAVLPSES
jgi:hypothetical protein